MEVDAPLATQVRNLKRELKTWEHAFEDEYGRKPTKEDILAASEGDRERDSLVYKFKLYAKLKAQLEHLSNPNLSPASPAHNPTPDSTSTFRASPRKNVPAKLVPKPIVTGAKHPVVSPPPEAGRRQMQPVEIEESEYATEDGSGSEYEDEDVRSQASRANHRATHPGNVQYQRQGGYQVQQAQYQGYPTQQQQQQMQQQAQYAQQQQAAYGYQQQQAQQQQAYQTQQAAAHHQQQLAYQQQLQQRSPTQQSSFVGVTSLPVLNQEHRPSTASNLSVAIPGSSRQVQQYPQQNPLAPVPVVLGPFGLPWAPHPVMGGGFGVRGFGDGLFKRLPPNTVLRCTLHRRRPALSLSPTYYLHNDADSDSFMLAARRRKKTKGVSYVIGMDPMGLKRGTGGKGGGYVAKLRANPQRTMFVLYDARSYDPIRSDKGLKERMLVEYVCEDWSRTALPREMHVGIPSTNLQDPEERSSNPDIVTDYRMHDGNRLSFLRNKPPRWNSGTQSHCLNFGGRVTEASIKNFQLVPESANPAEQLTSTEDVANRPVMQFGRTGPDTFCLDVMWPLSVVEAFALALSTFDAYDAS